MGTALVTGPTAGIGRSLAEQLAGHGHDLVLVSRDEERLLSTAAEISAQYRVECEVIPADLSVREEAERVAGRLQDPQRPVEWLINNAGSSVAVGFTDSSLRDELTMLDLLVTAPLILTHAALPGMIDRGRGRVLVVSSVAGFLPSGTYAAAKAWATTFAEGVSAQVRHKGVHVTALCPGFTHTEFHQRAGMDVSGVPDLLWQDADFVAEAGLRACSAGKPLVVPGGVYKGIQGLSRAMPVTMLQRLMARL